MRAIVLRSLRARMAILLIFLLMLPGGYAPLPQAREGVGEMANKSASVLPRLFNLSFHYYDAHVMLYLKEHPEYEAVEAMIALRAGKEPFIRAIITRHDQTQIDYLNDKASAMDGRSRNGRETHYAPIAFRRETKGAVTQVSLQFETVKGEQIDFLLHSAGKPSAKRGGLTDPGGHAGEECLPVMWRDKSTLAGAKSRIIIDGKQFPIPVEISIPIFFKGLKGYYSEGFSIGVLARGETEIEADLIDAVNAVAGVSLPDTRRPDKAMSIDFSPALAGLFTQKTAGKSFSQFSISIENHQDLIAGLVEVTAAGETTILKLIPQKPGWAVDRAMQIEITRVGDVYRVRSTMAAASS